MGLFGVQVKLLICVKSVMAEIILAMVEGRRKFKSMALLITYLWVS